MSIFELWLLTTAIPNIGVVSVVLALLLAIGGFFSLITGIIEEIPQAFLAGKRAIIAGAIFLFIAALIPSQKSMLLMAGGYVATNNQQISVMPEKAATAFNAWLDAVTDANTKEKE